MKIANYAVALLAIALLLCTTGMREVDAAVSTFDLVGGARSALGGLYSGTQNLRSRANDVISNVAYYPRLLKTKAGQKFSRPRKNNVATKDGKGGVVSGGKQGSVTNIQNQQVVANSGKAIDSPTQPSSNRGFVAKVTRAVTSAAYTVFSTTAAAIWTTLVISWQLLTRSIQAVRETKEWSKIRLEIERDRIREKQTCLPNPVMLYYFTAGLICAGLVGLWDAIDYFLKHWFVLFLAFLIMVVCLFIQAQGSELVTMAHSSSILGQRTANKVLGLSNTAADIGEVAVPIVNAQSYTSIQTMRMVFNVFIPPDYYVEAFSSSSDDEEAALQEDAMVNQELERSNGRRLEARVDADGKAQVWNVKKIARDLGIIALKVANIMVLTNMFALILYVIQLKLFVAFLDVILFVLSRVVVKIVCLIGHGYIGCSIREVWELVTVNLIRLILSAIGLGSLIPTSFTLFACGEDDFKPQAETLAPMCGGYLWETEPLGASLSGLKQKRVTMIENAAKEEADAKLSNYQAAPGSMPGGGGGGMDMGGRRLSEAVAGHGLNWVHCTRDPHDGSFVETMNGRRLHMTHGKRVGCPHTRDLVLHPVHERAMQFHRLNVPGTCLNVCLNGLHVLSCYDANQAYHPLLAAGECVIGEDGRVVGTGTGANHSMIHIKLQESFPELTERDRDVLIANANANADPSPPPPPPPYEYDSGVEGGGDNSSEASETLRRNLFSTMSQKIWSKSDVVRWLEGEYSGKFVLANKVECDIKRNKAPQGPHEAFMDTMCIAGRYLEGLDLNAALGGTVDFNAYAHLNRQAGFSLKGLPTSFTGASTGGHGRGRRLDDDVAQSRGGQGGLSLFEHALDFVKLADGMRRDTRLLQAAEAVGNDTFTRRVLSVVNEKPSFVNVYRHGFGQSIKALNRLLYTEPKGFTAAREGEGRRGRRLSEANDWDEDEVVTTSFQVVSHCPANFYLCANGFECVPSDELDLCSPLEVTEDTGYLAQANQYIQDIATYQFDLKGYIHEYCYLCWRDYDLKPQTNPFQYNVDADLSSARYCCGLIEPDLYRFEPLSETGISGFVTGICNVTDGNATVISNNCICPWYYPTSLSRTVYVSGFFDLHVLNHILNALVIVQTFISVYFTGETGVLFFIGYVWRAWAEFYCAGQCSAWFVDLFGSFGIESTATRRLTCVFLHAGSFFYTAFLLFGLLLLYIMVRPVITYVVDFYMAPFRRRLSRKRRKED